MTANRDGVWQTKPTPLTPQSAEVIATPRPLAPLPLLSAGVLTILSQDGRTGLQAAYFRRNRPATMAGGERVFLHKFDS
jgi:hypothetical protein